LDRRGELALMQAVGFRPDDLRYMLLIEHSLLLLGGALCGLIPAIWAVWPAVLTQGKSFPIGSIVLIILAMLVCGVLWIQLAGRVAMKKSFLDVLRNQ
jgi:ABC-type antimicrobial peptide transport system permease subunit